MNIYILLILSIILFLYSKKECRVFKEDLYNKSIVANIKEIDVNIDELCKKYNLMKMYEFSIKLSSNKVSNKRYSYGIGSKSNSKISLIEIKNQIFKKLKVSKKLSNIVNNFHKENNDAEIISIGFSKENDIDKIYMEIDEIKNYQPSIISYEVNKEHIYKRLYTHKYFGEYLYDELKKYKDFGIIFNKYFPRHKIKEEGFKYVTSKDNNIIALRIYCKEYNSINDIKYFIFEICNFFKMDNNNLIKVKKWIHHFQYNELNIIGLTLYPSPSITLYCDELTEYN